MLKAVKLEYKKYKKESNIIFMIIIGILITIFLIAVREEEFDIVFIASTPLIIDEFRRRYNKEFKNNVLKISAMTPIGKRNVIKAKLIVSAGIGLIFMLTVTIGLWIGSLIRGFEFNTALMILTTFLSINMKIITMKMIINNMKTPILCAMFLVDVAIVSICDYILSGNLMIYFFLVLTVTIINIRKFRSDSFDKLVSIDLK